MCNSRGGDEAAVTGPDVSRDWQLTQARQQVTIWTMTEGNRAV